jgi:hypothetical protein
MGPNGPRAVGGTSNSAPNAAGAAAVVLAAARRAGGNPTAAEVRGQLNAHALDLGQPGPDNVFGWGRVRVNTDPPRLARVRPARLASIRKRVTVKFTALTRSRPTSWRLSVDGTPATARAQTYPRGITIDTRRLDEGWHLMRAEIKDAPGNAGARSWPVFVDNTRPRLVVRRVAQARKVRKRRAVTVIVGALDKVGVGKLTTTATIYRAGRRRPQAKRVRKVAPGALRKVRLGRLEAGRYRVRLDLADRAGNRVTVQRRIVVR